MFAVGIFLLFSGYGLSKSIQTKHDCNKLLKYTTHILSTYLIVFLIKIVFDIANGRMTYSNVIVFACATLLILEECITFELGLNTTVTMALMYVPTAIVVCTNILNEKWTGNISALSLNFKKASAFTYYYHPILISVFSKFVNNSYILFAIVSFVMFAINCIFQKSGSKFYKTITK